MVLSACGGPYSGGSGGYKIRARDTVKIQTRALESVNSSRMSGGLTAVQLNPQLSSAAAVHSRDMAAQNRPWHFGSDGSSPLDRVADVLGPVFAGVLVDAIAMTAGTFGLFGGAFLGFWFARVCGFRLGRCFTVALLAGYYGYLAIPRFMPIATIVGIFFALKKLTDRHER